MRMHSHNFNEIRGSLRDLPDVGVQRCVDCGLTVHQSDVSSHVAYESGSMHNWAKSWGEINPPLEDLERRAIAIRRLIGDGPNQNYLDFGCGTGSMVSEMRKTNSRAFGYDPDGDAIMPDLLKINAAVTSVELLPSEPFRVLSLFHVIEHVYEIPGFLASLKPLLSETGYLLIETPNALDALITHYECDEFLDFTFWSHHPNLCTNKFLEEALEEAGYVVIDSSQVQRYGLNNHLHWLSEGKSGGHQIWSQFVTDSASDLYGLGLIEKGIGDTIWIVAQPRN